MHRTGQGYPGGSPWAKIRSKVQRGRADCAKLSQVPPKSTGRPTGESELAQAPKICRIAFRSLLPIFPFSSPGLGQAGASSRSA